MVKGRNEPCTMAQVAWVVAKLLEIPFEELVEEAWKNSVEMFGLEDGVWSKVSWCPDRLACWFEGMSSFLCPWIQNFVYLDVEDGLE